MNSPKWNSQDRLVSWGTLLVLAAAAIATSLGQGCGKDPPASGAATSAAPSATAASKAPAAARTRTLILGAYTTPREAYGTAILPAFRQHWRETHNEDVRFEESYLGSGAQARAVVGGFEADIVALSLEADVQKIVDAGLITHAWKAGPNAGMVTRSIVVFAVRQGNPKGLTNWPDLARDGIDVLTPNVKTSGGAMWNVLAIVGAATRGRAGVAANDPAAAETLLANVLRNVSIMDRGARESLITFERGVGDVAITYENEVLVGRQKGQTYEAVIPPSTILIENPIALVDRHVDEHGVRDVAEAFLAFVQTERAQRAFAEHGLRPVHDGVAREVSARFPTPADLFTVRDLGDWSGVGARYFADGAAYDRAVARTRAR